MRTALNYSTKIDQETRTKEGINVRDPETGEMTTIFHNLRTGEPIRTRTREDVLTSLSIDDLLHILPDTVRI